MNWCAYQLHLHLKTPMHLGWRRVGNSWQCRPYLPAYPLLCALAQRLTESGLYCGRGDDPYYANLNWLKDHIRLTYFFPTVVTNESGGAPELTGFLPCYREDGSLFFQQQIQVFGEGNAVHNPPQECPAAEFDYLFLDAQARTALSYPQRAARTGALYHFEFLRPWTRDHEIFTCKPVFLIGYILLDGEAQTTLLEPVSGVGKIFPGALFDHLQVGGERRLGWGLLRPKGRVAVPSGCHLFGLPGLRLELNQGVEILVEKNQPVLGHAVGGQEVQLRGPVEILLRRETHVKGGVPRAGYRVVAFGEEKDSGAASQPFHLPGSLVGEGGRFNLTRDGLWQSLEP